MLKLFILFCILQSISGATLQSIKIGFPPLSDYIVGGTDAEDGQAPYQCSMQKNQRHFCGCVIISEQWILSAAHCLDAIAINDVQILVGTNDLKSGGVFYTPKKYIIHEQYDQPPYANDIGLIQMDKIEFNEKVQPIKYSSKFVDEGENLLATGWGRISTNGPIPQFLQAINLTSVTNEEAHNALQGVAGNIVHESHLCTFTKAGEGVCNGDSGGPLVLDDEVVGLANWAVTCARGYPDGFARVGFFYDWIQEKIGSS